MSALKAPGFGPEHRDAVENWDGIEPLPPGAGRYPHHDLFLRRRVVTLTLGPRVINIMLRPSRAHREIGLRAPRGAASDILWQFFWKRWL